MLQPQLSGNRVVKRFYQPANTLKHTTWYARDAQACPERRRRGNILSIYERATPTSEVKQTEVHIYGSSRIGIEQRNITYSTSPFAWLESEQHRHAGTKRYELADHLGNVRVTISNLLVPRPASSFGYVTQDAEVIDRRDYYPFGMEMPGRRWRAATEGAGRYGFNGKENDNEVKGEGSQQDYGFRIYDPRVARFLSVDPLAHKLPSWTPYSFCFNNSLMFIDPTGAIPYPITIRAFAPFASFGLGFHGDDRGYTTSSTATARVHQRIKFDTDKTSIKTDAWSSPTSHILIPWSMTETPSARVTDGLKITQSGDAKTFEFGTHVAGSNPMVPGAPLIDVFSNFSITENRKAGTLDISGTLKGDNFPSTEAFITDPKGNNVFIGIGFYEGGPFTSLDGENKRDISRFKFSISTDDKGNFTGVKMGERAFSIGDWNKQFEKSDPHKNEEK